MEELIKYYQENSKELKSVFVLNEAYFSLQKMRMKVSFLNSSKLTNLSVTNTGGKITIVPKKFMKLYKALLFLKMSETMSKETIITMVDSIYDNKMNEFFDADNKTNYEITDVDSEDNSPDLEF